MTLDSWSITLIFIWLGMIIFGIYRKRYLLTAIFVALEISVLLISYFFDNRDYRMHIAVFGTTALYLVTLVFLMILLMLEFPKLKKE
ncbi:hypothetical protein [Brumimicrobium oceani]|nr:hypothetical protein [Brumimicrobium oceani]